MTLRFRLENSAMISAGDTKLRPIEMTETGGVFEHVGQPGITTAFTHEELDTLFKRHDTKIDLRHFDRPRQELLRDKSQTILNALPEKVIRNTLFRKAVCDALLTLQAAGVLSRTQESFETCKLQIAEEVQRRVGERPDQIGKGRPGTTISVRRLPGSRTAFSWLRTYEKGGFDAIALVPDCAKSGNRKPRWCPKTEVLANTVIEKYASPQRPTMVKAIDDTIALFAATNKERAEHGLPPLAVPSKASIKRRLKTADPFYVTAKRYDLAAAQKKFTLTTNGVDVVRPMERVEMDEHRLDVISLLHFSGVWDHLSLDRQAAIEKSRSWIYVAIDCATKCILSLRLSETPNAKDAVLALRDIMSDKTAYAEAAGCEKPWHHGGGIGTLVTDMGAAFVSDEFQGAVASLGITALLPPAGLPWLRGTIESLFRTFGHRVMPLLYGRTFSNPVDRGDYPSEQLACLCDDDLITILLTYVVDIYHHTPHGSLNGETPADAWDRLVAEHGTLPIPDGLAQRVAFGRPHTRKLSGAGVLNFGLTYSCDALRQAYLHSPTREVEVRADLRDIGWVAVKVDDHWYPALSNAAGFDGMSYQQLSEARRELRLKHQKAVLIDAALVRRALARIEARVQQALTLRELTPFHVSEEDIARTEAAMHFAIRPDDQRLEASKPSADPLSSGIAITLPTIGDITSDDTQLPQNLPTTGRRRRNLWTLNND